MTMRKFALTLLCLERQAGDDYDDDNDHNHDDDDDVSDKTSHCENFD